MADCETPPPFPVVPPDPSGFVTLAAMEDQVAALNKKIAELTSALEAARTSASVAAASADAAKSAANAASSNVSALTSRVTALESAGGSSGGSSSDSGSSGGSDGGSSGGSVYDGTTVEQRLARIEGSIYGPVERDGAVDLDKETGYVDYVQSLMPKVFGEDFANAGKDAVLRLLETHDRSAGNQVFGSLRWVEAENKADSLAGWFKDTRLELWGDYAPLVSGAGFVVDEGLLTRGGEDDADKRGYLAFLGAVGAAGDYGLMSRILTIGTSRYDSDGNVVAADGRVVANRLNNTLSADTGDANYLSMHSLLDEVDAYVYSAFVERGFKTSDPKTYVTTDDMAEYLKTADADERYLLATGADGAATYLKATDADEKYLAKSDAAGYLTKEAADKAYLPADTAIPSLDGYLTKTEANDTYLTIGALGGYVTSSDLSNYLKASDAANTYLASTDAAGFLKSTDAAKTYLALADAGAFLKSKDVEDTYLKIADANEAFVTQEYAAGAYLTTSALGDYLRNAGYLRSTDIDTDGATLSSSFTDNKYAGLVENSDGTLVFTVPWNDREPTGLRDTVSVYTAAAVDAKIEKAIHQTVQGEPTETQSRWIYVSPGLHTVVFNQCFSSEDGPFVFRLASETDLDRASWEADVFVYTPEEDDFSGIFFVGQPQPAEGTQYNFCLLDTRSRASVVVPPYNSDNGSAGVSIDSFIPARLSSGEPTGGSFLRFHFTATPFSAPTSGCVPDVVLLEVTRLGATWDMTEEAQEEGG